MDTTFAITILNRLPAGQEARKRPTNCGFRGGGNRVDQILRRRRTLEHRYHFERSTSWNLVKHSTPLTSHTGACFKATGCPKVRQIVKCASEHTTKNPSSPT